MKKAEENPPEIRRLADRLGAFYTPIAVLIALAGWLFSSRPYLEHVGGQVWAHQQTVLEANDDRRRGVPEESSWRLLEWQEPNMC